MSPVFWMAALLAVAACGDGGRKDYDAEARCQSLGYRPGTGEYDRCMEEEKLGRMMQRQRQDYERMKQLEMDQKLRRY